MKNNKFPAKILKVEPNTIDEFGVIYDWDILVESTKGEIFWLFVPSIICDKEMEGQMSIIEFSVGQNADLMNLIKLKTKQKKIVPPKCLYDRNSPNYSAVFYGEIIGKKSEPDSNSILEVDVGSGIILVIVRKKEYDNFLVGEYIMIEGNLVHLEEIDGMRT
ncbi:hypothetical protein V7O62_00015 [Methanolobus sp. ZRKC2]|uniref:hypothetical protein n=1 Tax=Methanolobus sp. ZRKC2 TaxID=3125783 RepID=UPI00324A4B49